MQCLHTRDTDSSCEVTVVRARNSYVPRLVYLRYRCRKVLRLTWKPQTRFQSWQSRDSAVNEPSALAERPAPLRHLCFPNGAEIGAAYTGSDCGVGAEAALGAGSGIRCCAVGR